ncbi:hypothetical protein BC829DRAFT_74795 [Chytridium lagenaria]|nr:hypothetical protein BC829DRAFT_74795 [Chytridium lagenaria]
MRRVFNATPAGGSNGHGGRGDTTAVIRTAQPTFIIKHLGPLAGRDEYAADADLLSSSFERSSSSSLSSAIDSSKSTVPRSAATTLTRDTLLPPPLREDTLPLSNTIRATLHLHHPLLPFPPLPPSHLVYLTPPTMPSHRSHRPRGLSKKVP